MNSWGTQTLAMNHHFKGSLIMKKWRSIIHELIAVLAITRRVKYLKSMLSIFLTEYKIGLGMIQQQHKPEYRLYIL